MKYLKRFEESLAGIDQSLPVMERTKKLSEEEFIQILNDKCKNFSFNSDLLWRNKKKKNDLELFNPNPRNAKPVAFPNFFNEIEKDPDYPVVRKKSLIGGTNKNLLKDFVELDNYLVIPFDNSEIVFCPVFDLWALVDDRKSGREIVNNEPISKKHFVKVEYTKNFTIPNDKLDFIINNYYKKYLGKQEYGYEFFTSSPCLLVHESKVDWLKSIN
jgi:hypothetical protein